MFVLKSTHKTALLNLEDVMTVMRTGHLAEVQALREQIADLRRLVFVPAPSHVEALPSRQANAVLDGVEVIPKKDVQEEDDAVADANRILSGQYDNVEESW